MGASPTVRRRRLTAELRSLRETSGRTIDEVAGEVGISKSSLSRVENGLVVPRIPVLRGLLSTYGVTGEQAAWLEQLCRDAKKKGWWELAGSSAMRDATRTLIGLEAEATRINQFSISVLTGLVQVRPYARAVLKATLPDADEDKIDALVETRMRRQERLGDFRFWIILAEELLMRPVGGPRAMRAQVERLVELAEPGSRTTVQVLARRSGEHPGMGGPFSILGFDSPDHADVVYAEASLWDVCIEEPRVIESYKEYFETLQAMAVGPTESWALLAQYVKEYKE
jgi:transcriptional regulator with XRE-family HTH domain